VRHQHPHCRINYICLFLACFQIIFKFVVDMKTSFLDSVTVNTVLQTESEACQKQWLASGRNSRGSAEYEQVRNRVTVRGIKLILGSISGGANATVAASVTS